MENDFRKARIGDKVFHIMYGWGEISELNSNTFGVVFTDKNNKRITSWFFYNGKSDSNYINPSVFWDEAIITPPPKPKRKVEKILEGWLNIYPNKTCNNDLSAMCYSLYKSQDLADKTARKERRIGESCYVIHKYTIEE